MAQWRFSNKPALWHRIKAQQLKTPTTFDECYNLQHTFMQLYNNRSTPKTIRNIWRDAFSKAIMRSPLGACMLTCFHAFGDMENMSLSEVPESDFHNYERAPFWLFCVEGHDSPERIEQELRMRTDWNDDARRALFLYMQTCFDENIHYMHVCRVERHTEEFEPSHFRNVSVDLLRAIFNKAPLPMRLVHRLRDAYGFHLPFHAQELAFLEAHQLPFHLFGTPPVMVRDWMLNLTCAQLEALMPRLVAYLPDDAHDQYAQHALGPLLAGLLRSKETEEGGWMRKLQSEGATPLMQLVMRSWDDPAAISAIPERVRMHPRQPQQPFYQGPAFAAVVRNFRSSPTRVDQSRGDAMQQIVALMEKGIWDGDAAKYCALATAIPPFGGFYEQLAWRTVDTGKWLQLPQRALFAIVFHSAQWIRMLASSGAEEENERAVAVDADAALERLFDAPVDGADGADEADEEDEADELLHALLQYHAWLDRLGFFGESRCLGEYDAWVQAYGANAWVDTGYLPRILQSMVTNNVALMSRLKWRECEEVADEFNFVCKAVKMAGNNAPSSFQTWVTSANAWVDSITTGLVTMALFPRNPFHAWRVPGVHMATHAAIEKCASTQDARVWAQSSVWWCLVPDERPDAEAVTEMEARLLTAVCSKRVAMKMAAHLMIDWSGGWHKSTRTLALTLRRAGVTADDFYDFLGYDGAPLPLCMAHITVPSQAILAHLARERCV